MTTTLTKFRVHLEADVYRGTFEVWAEDENRASYRARARALEQWGVGLVDLAWQAEEIPFSECVSCGGSGTKPVDDMLVQCSNCDGRGQV